MEPNSTVLEASVQFEGETYTAAYFIEHGIIHANIGGRTLMAPFVSDSAEKIVETLLIGNLAQVTRKTSNLSQWSYRRPDDEQSPPLNPARGRSAFQRGQNH